MFASNLPGHQCERLILGRSSPARLWPRSARDMFEQTRLRHLLALVPKQISTGDHTVLDDHGAGGIAMTIMTRLTMLTPQTTVRRIGIPA